MTCIHHEKYFATRGFLTARSLSTTLHHSSLQVVSFAKRKKFRVSQDTFKKERIQEDKMSPDWSHKFLSTHGNLPNRLGNGAGAGRIVGYIADSERRQVKDRRSAAQETMDMLGWPSLCDTVARFASTAMGKELCHGLTPPPTREESQTLLDETSAALEIDGILGGVLDFGALQTPIIKSGLDRVSKGMDVSGNELAAIASLLQVALTLQRGIAPFLEESKGKKVLLQPISKLLEPMVVHQDIMKLIWSKVDEDGSVKDIASPQLRQARIQARTLEQRLQELLNKLARESSAPGGEQEVIDVDGRLCLTVTTGAASSVPGLLFQRGSTAYLEPSQAVSLNSKLAEARLEVQSAERAVLSGIAAKVRSQLADVNFVLEIIVRLDMIAARGKYSSWIGGRKPEFVDSNVHEQSSLYIDGSKTFKDGFDGSQDPQFLMNLKRLRHPLLVEQYHNTVRKAKAKLKGKTKLLSRMRVRTASTTSTLDEVKSSVAEAEMEVAAAEERAPVPIDVRVRSHTRVVAITGPNAGGKTAAIKAVGLAALMAKVGLYVLAMDPVDIPWFDAVFADIGDEQSLGQSLSTFSGHLTRIKRIMTESTEQSLVLLDELSAGTDPTEGAALGMALLEFFAAGGSLLTLATTHHGELKTLKYSDHRFENACVEFDEENLAPTYKLLWGIPGRSNAINVARRQGLPRPIISSAESLYGAASAELNEVIMKLEGAKVDFDQSREVSEALVDEMKEFYSQLVVSAERLYEQSTVLYEYKCEQLSALASAAHLRLGDMARIQSQSMSKPMGGQRTPTKKQAIVQKPSGTDGQVRDGGQRKDGQVSNVGSSTDGQTPRIGQLVYVPKLGRDAKIVGVNTTKKEVTVQSGFLQIKIDLKELQ
ncbi:unnamed protein product [Calypogeia fissa]